MKTNYCVMINEHCYEGRKVACGLWSVNTVKLSCQYMIEFMPMREYGC